jgi:hypothetical protein
MKLIEVDYKSCLWYFANISIHKLFYISNNTNHKFPIICSGMAAFYKLNSIPFKQKEVE